MFERLRSRRTSKNNVGDSGIQSGQKEKITPELEKVFGWTWKKWTLIAAFLAAFATALTNLEKIGGYAIYAYNAAFSRAHSIPTITLRLENKLDAQVDVSSRGEFMLFLPAAEGQHYSGVYQTMVDGEKLYEWISIPPNEIRSIYVSILDKKYSGALLTEDHTMMIFVRVRDSGIFATQPFPFSRDFIQKYTLPVQINSR